MENNLQERFANFLQAARLNFQNILGERATSWSVMEAALPRFVADLEKQEEFRGLVMLTRSAFSGDYHQLSTARNWQSYVHNFLCQAGYYLDLLDGREIDIDAAFSSYCASFEKRLAKVRYLAPLEFMSFEQPSTALEFDAFEIRRFSIRELDGMLRNRLNSIFYPYAALDKRALELLSRYWFVHVVKDSPVEEVGHFYLPASPTTTLLFAGYAERRFTEYARPVESALRVLCLFDWSSLEEKIANTGGLSRDQDWRSLRLVNVPFVLEISGDLLRVPNTSPDFSKLVTQPIMDIETGDQLGEVPEEWITLGPTETQRFKVFTQNTARILSDLKVSEYGWEFMDIALGYFMKAFFAMPGLDQMLWYITSLEALLGERGVGVSKRLAERAGAILSTLGGGKKNKYSKRFEELYQLRNSLVHGAQFKKQARVAHLVDTYLFARSTILWFLHTLEAIQRKIINGETDRMHVPGREEILMLLDLDRKAGHRLKRLLDKLPETFFWQG